METRKGKHLLCKFCKNDTGYADSKKYSLSLTKDHLKYILSLDDKTKRLVKAKLFKKSKDLKQNQIAAIFFMGCSRHIDGFSVLILVRVYLIQP